MFTQFIKCTVKWKNIQFTEKIILRTISYTIEYVIVIHPLDFSENRVRANRELQDVGRRWVIPINNYAVTTT